MTLAEARSLSQGSYVHHVHKTNSDGTPMRARVTSVKTWKTRPEEVEVRVKHGLKDYATFYAHELYLLNVGYGS